MKLCIGSQNKTKFAGVGDAVLLYPEIFPEPDLIAVDVAVEEFGHPRSLDETVKGAMDRARAAFSDCAYSFGIEGGLMAVPHTKTGFMEVGACAIYDGKNFHIGLSPAFEWPAEALDLILNQGLDGSQAVREIGLSDAAKIGEAGGIISLLTQGKVTRQEQTRDSVIMAITQLLRPE